MEKHNNSNEPKKRLPGGFFLFLLATLLIILTMQNFSNDEHGQVSFSHQIEHLVNLDLIHKGDSYKTAQNDNLVTFQGKFRQQVTEEATKRHRYLELLNEHYLLDHQEAKVSQALTTMEQDVKSSAIRFLTVSGIKIPKGGFSVVSPSYDTHNRKNSIIIESIPAKDSINVMDMQKEYDNVSRNLTSSSVRTFGSHIEQLVQAYASPLLGISTVSKSKMKKRLDSIGQSVSQALNSSQSPEGSLPIYYAGLEALHEITLSLVTPNENNIRLSELRSVRSYVYEVSQYQEIVTNNSENIAQLNRSRRDVADVVWFFDNQELSTSSLEKQDPEVFSLWYSQSQKEWDAFSANAGASFKAPDQPRNLVLEKTFKSRELSPNYLSYIFLTIFPVVLVLLVLYFIFSRQMKGMGSGAMSFGKSPAKMLNKSLHKITFKDVAGVVEAKEELQEVVDFLKDPLKFTALGARIPKGVLLVGQPGTGKTLIAKAVAGEANRPFFSISGSNFVEMFVGVGASRIRDLFEQAKKNAPCIVFIDEIDAVGRHRGSGVGGGHDEREQTLNQLLVEMDGFETNEGVILMAATNRPDVLDKALLRPGRFDRNVILDLPDIKGRFEILKVHARKIKLDPAVDLMAIARGAAGSSGADLMNILNESALLAARKGRSAVIHQDTLDASDKVRYGKERRSLELGEKEKTHTAYHESGHAIVGLCVNSGDPIEKVTIVPRGFSLGATHFIPEKNKVSYWRKELIDRLAVLMGGRIAEDLFIGDISSGAQMDISQGTKLARSMVCQWGMSDELGPVAYDEQSQEGSYLMPGQSIKNYSEATAQKIDEKVLILLEEANTFAREVLEKHKDDVELMKDMLIEFESLDREDVHAIIDGKWDIEKKRKKMTHVKEAHIEVPPPPPPPPQLDGDPLHQGDDPTPQLG